MTEVAPGHSYKLYYHSTSLRSNMIRLLLAFAGNAEDCSFDDIHLVSVDILQEEQFSEAFMRDVNPRGTVPVLANDAVLEYPLNDTVAISAYITARDTDLQFAEMRDVTRNAIDELHAINFFSLSCEGGSPMPETFQQAANIRLADDHISQWYKLALKRKRTHLYNEMVIGTESESVAKELSKATRFLQRISAFANPQGGQWLFGRERASELDAHLAVLLARLYDTGHEAIIPSPLKHYFIFVSSSPEWKNLMEHRRRNLGETDSRKDDI